MKLDELQSSLGRTVDGFLITSPENIRYFTGLCADDAVLAVSRTGAVLLADSRYYEAACAAAQCEVILLRRLSEDLPRVVRSLGCRSMYVEALRLTVGELALFNRLLPETELRADGGADLIHRLRRAKTAAEVALIRRAQGIAEAAFEHILGFIRAGVTERETAFELDCFMLRSGAAGVSFKTIVVSGARGSLPHGEPTDESIADGTLVTMDFGAIYSAYHSDMTRTVAVGAPCQRAVKVYETVLAAQENMLASLRPGKSLRGADNAARSVIEQAGYGEYFGHSAGHGVGLEIHEAPSLSPRSEGELEPGDIVTAEPGIYLPGRLGVRIEDMALITEDGYENLTSSSKKLLII